jgi:hypothetical protein
MTSSRVDNSAKVLSWHNEIAYKDFTYNDFNYNINKCDIT